MDFKKLCTCRPGDCLLVTFNELLLIGIDDQIPWAAVNQVELLVRTMSELYKRQSVGNLMRIDLRGIPLIEIRAAISAYVSRYL